jgi:hypothetical protein
MIKINKTGFVNQAVAYRAAPGTLYISAAFPAGFPIFAALKSAYEVL